MENIDDILDELFLERLNNKKEEYNTDLQNLSVIEKAVYELIDYEPTQIEQLISRAQRNSREVNAILTRLELKGYISALPGGYFVRN